MNQEMTSTISAIWERALGVADITPEENFFDLGGDSLTAAKIVALVDREYGLESELRLVFDNPTIEEFVEAVDELLIAAPQPGGGA